MVRDSKSSTEKNEQQGSAETEKGKMRGKGGDTSAMREEMMSEGEKNDNEA